MKLFKKTAALIFTLLMSLSLLASCSGVPEQKKEEKTYEGTHEQIINAFYEDHKDTAAGMMVGVFDRNGTVYEGYYGYSNVAEGIKVDENTVIDGLGKRHAALGEGEDRSRKGCQRLPSRGVP